MCGSRRRNLNYDSSTRYGTANPAFAPFANQGFQRGCCGRRRNRRGCGPLDQRGLGYPQHIQYIQAPQMHESARNYEPSFSDRGSAGVDEKLKQRSDQIDREAARREKEDMSLAVRQSLAEQDRQSRQYRDIGVRMSMPPAYEYTEGSARNPSGLGSQQKGETTFQHAGSKESSFYDDQLPPRMEKRGLLSRILGGK